MGTKPELSMHTWPQLSVLEFDVNIALSYGYHTSIMFLNLGYSKLDSIEAGVCFGHNIFKARCWRNQDISEAGVHSGASRTFSLPVVEMMQNMI